MYLFSNMRGTYGLCNRVGNELHWYSVWHASETFLMNTCLNEACNLTLSAALNSCLVASGGRVELIYRHYLQAFLLHIPLGM